MTDLPQPRGRLTPNRDLSDLTWLRVGGPADWLFQPADADDLSDFLPRSPPIYRSFRWASGRT
jgi:UDP-N-acetylmuramate dehydrogenase